MEEVINIFSDVFGTPFHEHDDFLERGGDSMMLKQIIRKLDHRFNKTLTEEIIENIEIISPHNIYQLYI